MALKDIGIILNGATGRIGATQHLANALAPIRAEGGLAVGPDRVVPRLLLLGRDRERARRPGADLRRGGLDRPISTPRWPSPTFRSSSTPPRPSSASRRLSKAIAAGKHIYSEKPVAPSVAQGLWRCCTRRSARGLQARRGRGQDRPAGPAETFARSRKAASSAASPASGSISAGGCSTAPNAPASARAGITARASGGGLTSTCIRTGAT